MMNSYQDCAFKENLLRSYLGKYNDRFKLLKIENNNIILCTDPRPLLIIQYHHMWISLSEYIQIEEDDPYYGSFDHYQIPVTTVLVEDPNGMVKIEKAVAKLFLSGSSY